MNLSIINSLYDGCQSISKHYYKQIYVHEYQDGDNVACFSKENHYPLINVNIFLSEMIKEFPSNQRPFKISEVLNRLINDIESHIVCIDYFELLFEPTLKVKPFNLFSNLSKNKTLIIAWRGSIKDNCFIYAEPGHPEYISYSTKDAMIIK